jgi:hypothetical protein
MHRQARRLQKNKWLLLPRVTEAGTAKSLALRQNFAERQAQQLIWEAASRLKAKRLTDFLRIAFGAARLYPLSTSEKVFSEVRQRFLIKSRGNRDEKIEDR